MDGDHLFESVPNFSEGRDGESIAAIAAGARRAHVLDVDPDADHHRVVISLAAFGPRLVDALMGSFGVAIDRIDVRRHKGVHPRVGALDVLPIVPLGDTTLASCRELARELGERIWAELRVPVYFYGEHQTLADVRAGRGHLDLGGPDLHPTAGAVCVGARQKLVAFNVILAGLDIGAARALARSLRESRDGLRGVQALVFELPGGRVQLSMNLFRLEETSLDAVMAELERRGVAVGAQQVVGLCPAVVANPAAAGRLLEARQASSAARAGSVICLERGGDEHLALAAKLLREAGGLAALGVGQADLLAGAERAAALVQVLRAAGALEPELEAMLLDAARGLRAAIRVETQAAYGSRFAALERRLDRRREDQPC
jgi:glutamate formiminotransferase / 5-formyltetrahydrofolate cyclo-ligase